MDFNRDVSIWNKFIQYSMDLFCAIDAQGWILSINNASKTVLGYNEEELQEHNIKEFLHPDDVDASKEAIEAVVGGKIVRNFENRYLHKRGHVVFMQWSATWSAEDQVMYCVGRDISDKKAVAYKEALHKALIEHGGDMLALLDANLNYIYSGGSISKQLGYSHSQLIGTNALSYIHPEDVPAIQETVTNGLSIPGYITSATFRFKDAEGGWRWVESTLSNQLQNPAIAALVTTSRDVTEKINNKIILQESQQRFKSLFDNNLDMVLFKRKDGVIVDANPVARTFFKIPENTGPDQPVSAYLPKELLHISDQAFQDALQGKLVRFSTSVPVKGKGLCSFDISKVPVVVKGEIIGVYSILKDITLIEQSNNTIRRQAKKLVNIFESITDAFFTLDKEWKITYVNNVLEKLFREKKNSIIGKNLWERNLGSNRQLLEKQYFQAVETGIPANFEMYIEPLNLWLQIKAFPSGDGLSVFMTDITQRINEKQELETLSLVASKTTNGVVITDAQSLTVWVNEGFTNLTGYTLADMLGKIPGTVLSGKDTNIAFYNQLLESRSLGKPFQGEMLAYKKSGEKAWYLLDVSPVYNQAGQILKFVTIQTDITSRKEAEESLLLLAEDLQKQNRDLQQFTYIVSHNLRAPVANALGLVDVLSMVDKDSEHFITSLGYLNKSIRHLDSVLRDINMILSIRDKKDIIDRKKVYLALICKQAMESLQSSLQECSGEVLLHLSDELSVNGDTTYLYSIFYNLFTNAIKYRSPKRALKIEIALVKSTETGCTVSFSDNGSGFDMNLAGEKVFKLYKRFHTASEGRGMGLFLVKKYLNAIGADIEVSSEVNKGTRFLLHFDCRV